MCVVCFVCALGRHGPSNLGFCLCFVLRACVCVRGSLRGSLRACVCVCGRKDLALGGCTHILFECEQRVVVCVCECPLPLLVVVVVVVAAFFVFVFLVVGLCGRGVSSDICISNKHHSHRVRKAAFVAPKVGRTSLLLCVCVAVTMGINTSKPLDGSDVTNLEEAREEIKRLRAVAALGANNLLLLTDSYKVTHWVQYPKGTTTIYSYFESRGGKHVDVVHFGLQYFLKRYLCGVVVTPEKIAEAEMMYSAHFGPGSVFPRDKWMHIVEKHGGRLPIRICAPAEGSVIPYKNVLMTVENTDPECFWLTNFLETLLVQVWYPTTVASNSRAQMKVIKRYLLDTADPHPDGSYGELFKLHDFGFRGVSSVETSALGAAAHLVNFRGTDTISGLVLARDFYAAGGGEKPGGVAGYSIPASEHSTITSWGKDGELAAFENMLVQFPSGLVACVSDSFDIYRACGPEMWGKLREKILNRPADAIGNPGRLVVRPDSGDPKTVDLKILEILGETFGKRKNSKGFWVSSFCGPS